MTLYRDTVDIHISGHELRISVVMIFLLLRICMYKDTKSHHQQEYLAEAYIPVQLEVQSSSDYVPRH